jgi:hypothetical protein
MKRMLGLIALLVLALALPSGATAKKGHQSKTKNFKGSFYLVGADGAYTDKKFGKAHLQDHKKKDKLHVHVRRLAPNTTYVYGLFSVAKGEDVCKPGASGGTLEDAFELKAKKTNSAGNFNSKQRSKTFVADRTERYFVLVFTTKPDGSPDEAVACAALKGKKHKKHANKGQGQGRENRGKGHDEKQRGSKQRGSENRGSGNRGSDRGGAEKRGRGPKK